MGVYIKDMEMPKKSVALILFPDGNVHVFRDDIDHDEWLKAIELPPHGRLIEESKVLDIVFEWCPDDDGSVGKDGDLREMLDEIEALPTIIPAEEGE